MRIANIACACVMLFALSGRGALTDPGADPKAVAVQVQQLTAKLQSQATAWYEYIELRSQLLAYPVSDELLVQVETDRRCDLDQYRDPGDPMGAKVGQQLLELLRGPNAQLANDLLNAEMKHGNWAAINPVLQGGDTAVRTRVLAVLQGDSRFLDHMTPGMTAAFGDPSAAVRMRCLTAIIPDIQMSWNVSGHYDTLFGMAFSDPDPEIRKLLLNVVQRGQLINQRGFAAAVVRQAKEGSPIREDAWRLLGSVDRMTMGMMWVSYGDDPAFNAMVMAAMMDPSPSIRMNSHFLWDALHPFVLTFKMLFTLAFLALSILGGLALGVRGQFRYPALPRRADPAPASLRLSVLLGHVAGIMVIAGGLIALAMWWSHAGFSHLHMGLIGAALVPLPLLGYAIVNWSIAGGRGNQFDHLMQVMTLAAAAIYGVLIMYLYLAVLKLGLTPAEGIAPAGIAMICICILAALSWTRVLVKSGSESSNMQEAMPVYGSRSAVAKSPTVASSQGPMQRSSAAQSAVAGKTQRPAPAGQPQSRPQSQSPRPSGGPSQARRPGGDAPGSPPPLLPTRSDPRKRPPNLPRGSA